MSIRSTTARDRGASKNQDPYRAAFLRRAFDLLAEGYGRLDLARLAGAEEPAITGELVRCIEEYLDDPARPAWADRFVIHDDPPVNQEGRLGKARPRVDIMIQDLEPRPHTRFQIEAKRLRQEDSHCLSAYLGNEGLGRFLSGKYGAGLSDVGMLGYVQSGAPDDWSGRIWGQLTGRREYVVGSWRRVTWTATLPHCYQSEHDRSGAPQPLRVYHALLRVDGVDLS